MESNSTLDSLKAYIEGDRTLTDGELLDCIKSCLEHNKELFKCSNMVIEDINKEVF